MLQVIIPISDNTIFFPKEEYFFPKPIVEVLNKPLIVQVVKHIEKYLKPDSLIFVIPKELEIKWSIKRIISLSLETKSSCPPHEVVITGIKFDIASAIGKPNPSPWLGAT